MRYTLTMLETHQERLRELLLADGKEAGAYMLCGRSLHADPWTGDREERFLVRDIIAVGEEAYEVRASDRMTWSTTPLYDVTKRSERRGEAVAIVHSHPQGPLRFSSADDDAEKEAFDIVFTRLESERPHLSVIIDGSGELIARAYGPDLKPNPVDMVRMIGNQWRFRYPTRADGTLSRELDRQVRAFGSIATRDLSELRFGIAGCGGTGSAVAMLLARMGARKFVFFDTDLVDESNLNRLHFATRVHANLRERKVDVVARGVAELGLPTSVIRIASPVDSPSARDALRACDVVFGCTDDALGRNTLNRLAHFYLIPVIDLGLLIEPAEEGYAAFDGRVTVVQPGYPCQTCRRLISSQDMHEQSLYRSDPVLYAHYQRAGYVRGSREPNPAVVSFTTEVATMAVNELWQRLTGFRGVGGSCSERVRRFSEVKEADALPAGQSRPGCKLCDARRYDGRGDMVPFLDQT